MSTFWIAVLAAAGGAIVTALVIAALACKWWVEFWMGWWNR